MRKERNTTIVLLLTLILITLVILCVLIATGRLDTVGQSEEEKQTTITDNIMQNPTNKDHYSGGQLAKENDNPSDKKEKSPQASSIGQKTEEEIQNIANEAFEVWKALDQRIWMLFSNRDDLTLSNLIDIYSRYCMNTPEKENLITITEENATEEMKNLRGTFFKAEGFREFSKNYFGINIKDFTTESPSYCSKLDAYSLSPTPPIPIEIFMKDYSTNGSQINLIVEYNDDEYHSYQECCVTVVMTEEGFYFDSCELLYNSEE